MKIAKDQILQLLHTEGRSDQADNAKGELPDEVDTDNQEHTELLSKFGIDIGDIAGKLGGLGNLL